MPPEAERTAKEARQHTSPEEGARRPGMTPRVYRGGKGAGSGMFSHCHSGLFLLVIPDVIHRESKGGVRGDRGTRRSPNLPQSLLHGAEKKTMDSR